MADYAVANPPYALISIPPKH